MTDNVTRLNTLTKLDLSPDLVLNEAKGHLDEVVLIGTDKDGLYYFASSIADSRKSLWLVENFKLMLLSEDPE